MPTELPDDPTQAAPADPFRLVRAAIELHGDELAGYPGVISVRPGYRFKAGRITPEPAVLVSVRRKQDPSDLGPRDLLPRRLGKVPVDVVPASPHEQLASAASAGRETSMSDAADVVAGLAAGGNGPSRGARTPTVKELMDVPEAGHDLDWLKAGLQRAIQLEFGTIPPYLTAFWSVKSGTAPAARSIRVIFREEMLHFGLVCNLLCGLGGTPVLNTPAVQPVYPGPLPGIDTGGLTVSLRGLSADALKVFMEIEYPEFDPVAEEESYPTIGAFYSAILAAFETLNPFPLATDRQPAGPLGMTRIESLPQVRDAVGLIKRQGEGSKDSPEDTGLTDLAHYYRFGELYHGRKLRKDPATNQYRFDGDPVPFPDVWPMAGVPAGGYRQADVTPEVWGLLSSFDQAFTRVMNLLQDAWSRSGAQGQAALDDAVAAMFDLGDPAVELMQIAIPSGAGNYGPCFRLV